MEYNENQMVAKKLPTETLDPAWMGPGWVDDIVKVAGSRCVRLALVDSTNYGIPMPSSA